jgi:hypothetical protein
VLEEGHLVEFGNPQELLEVLQARLTADVGSQRLFLTGFVFPWKTAGPTNVAQTAPQSAGSAAPTRIQFSHTSNLLRDSASRFYGLAHGAQQE